MLRMCRSLLEFSKEDGLISAEVSGAPVLKTVVNCVFLKYEVTWMFGALLPDPSLEGRPAAFRGVFISVALVAHACVWLHVE